MDSPARTSRTLLSFLLPLAAVYQEDLRQSVRHWAFIAWAVVGTMLTVIWFAAPREQAPPKPQPIVGQVQVASMQSVAPTPPAPAPAVVPTASQLAAKLLRVHLLLWASFVIALGATAISGDADSAPESILCRGVGRWQYFLGKSAARITAVVALLVVLTLPAIVVGALRMPNDLTAGGVMRGIWTVALTLGALTALSVAGSSWFKNPLVGTALVWMTLYGAGIVAAVLEVTPVSPLVLVETLPDLLRGSEPMLHAQLPVFLTSAALAATLVSMTAYSFRDV